MNLMLAFLVSANANLVGCPDLVVIYSMWSHGFTLSFRWSVAPRKVHVDYPLDHDPAVTAKVLFLWTTQLQPRGFTKVAGH